MEGHHPVSGGPAKGKDIPPVSYLKWYIPRLKEMREHNLSFSGLQFPWMAVRGDTVIEAGDTVIIFVTRGKIAQVEKLLSVRLDFF